MGLIDMIAIMCRFAVPEAILIMVILAGCGRGGEVESRLERIESELMESRPDSALAVLESMDVDELPSDRARALHGMLMAQARHKNYIDQTDDRDISSACRYFRDHGDDRRAMKSFFYRAVIQEESADYTHATNSLMEAEEYAKEIDDKYYLGRIYDLFADLNYDIFNQKEDLKYRKLASQYFNMADSFPQYYYSLIEVAISYNNNDMPEKCVALLDSLSSLSKFSHKNDSIIQVFKLCSYLPALLNLKNYSRMDSIINIIEKHQEYDYSPYDYSIIIRFYTEQNKLEKAEFWIEKYSNLFGESGYSQIGYHMALHDYYLKNRDYNKALDHNEIAFMIHNDKIKEALDQTVVVAQRDYHRLKNKSAEWKTRRLKWMLTVFIVFGCAIGIVLFLFHKERVRRKNSEINEYILEVQKLSSDAILNNQQRFILEKELNQKNSDMDNLVSRINVGDEELGKLRNLANIMLKEHYETLNKLCDEFFDVRNTPQQRPVLYKKVQDEIQRMCSKQSIDKIERLVDGCMDGIVKKLRSQFPGFKEIDVEILTLTFAGFSSRTICLMTGINLGYFYNKRKRIKDRRSMSEAIDKDIFLQKMEIK